MKIEDMPYRVIHTELCGEVVFYTLRPRGGLGPVSASSLLPNGDRPLKHSKMICGACGRLAMPCTLAWENNEQWNGVIPISSMPVNNNISEDSMSGSQRLLMACVAMLVLSVVFVAAMQAT